MQAAKGIAGIGLHASQGCGRVDVPESHLGARGAALEHTRLEQFVVRSNTAVLDDKVRAGGLGEESIDVAGSAVNNHIRIVHFVLVAILPASVDVGLGEGDFVAQSGKVFVNTAIVGRGSVPVTGSNARSEDKNSHLRTSSQISRSCAARCAQVCRLRIVSRPLAAISARARWSRSRVSISPAICFPSAATM